MIVNKEMNALPISDGVGSCVGGVRAAIDGAGRILLLADCGQVTNGPQVLLSMSVERARQVSIELMAAADIIEEGRISPLTRACELPGCGVLWRKNA